jgi:DNA-binding transcriptional LysR family regulator
VDELNAFRAVAEEGGFTPAAAALGTTVASVSRRIKALERRLGVRLFNRTTRQVSLTEAGEIYLRHVQRALDGMADGEAAVQQLTGEARGTLRIAAPLSFGVRRLAPVLSRFARQHPDLRVRLSLDDRVVDVVEGGHDLAVRIGYPPDSGLIGRAILPVARYLCASPGYLQARGTPALPKELATHDCLHYNPLAFREEWALKGDRSARPVTVEGRLCSNNGDVLCQAAIAGMGIALLPDFIVEDALARGELQRILRGFEPPPFTLYAVYPSREFVPAKVRLFLDALVVGLGGPGSAGRAPPRQAAL